MRGGRIGSVSAPRSNAGGARSEMINPYVVPILEQEAVAVQGLNSNALWGAALANSGLSQSLRSALQKAGK